MYIYVSTFRAENCRITKKHQDIKKSISLCLFSFGELAMFKNYKQIDCLAIKLRHDKNINNAVRKFKKPRI